MRWWGAGWLGWRDIKLLFFFFQMVICLCGRGGPLNFSSRPDGDQKRRGEGEGSREPCAAPSLRVLLETCGAGGGEGGFPGTTLVDPAPTPTPKVGDVYFPTLPSAPRCCPGACLLLRLGGNKQKVCLPSRCSTWLLTGVRRSAGEYLCPEGSLSSAGSG